MKLDREHVEELLCGSASQAAALLALYRLALPDWDKIEKLAGYPRVNKATWVRIADLFLILDKKHSPNCLPGGWMNFGYSCVDSEDLADWEVAIDRCKPVCRVPQGAIA